MTIDPDRVAIGKLLLEAQTRFAAYDQHSFTVKPGSNSTLHIIFNSDGSFMAWSSCAHPEKTPGIRDNKSVGGVDREEFFSVLREYLADPQWAYNKACTLIK